MRRPFLLRLSIIALGVLLLTLFPSPVAFVDAIRLGDAWSASAIGFAESLCPGSYPRAAQPAALPPLGPRLPGVATWADAGQAFRRANGRRATYEGWSGLGDSLAGRQDWAQAMQAWLEALQFEPQNAELYVRLGRAFMAQGLFDQARPELERAIALAPDHRRAHGLLGLLGLDDPASARPHLEQVGDPALMIWLDRIEAAQESPPDGGPAQPAILAASLLLHFNQPALARHHLENHLAQHPDDPVAMATLGYTLNQLGETVLARQTLLRALELNPDLGLGYLYLGLHELDLGRWQSARDNLQAAVRRDPTNAAASAALGGAYAMLHDYEAAAAWYTAAVQQAPDGQENAFRLLLANFYLDYTYQVPTAGLAAAQEAARLAPNDAHALDLLGWALHLSGRYAEAESTLHQALALAPDLASAEFHLGSLYATLGHHSRATEHLRRAAGLDTTGSIRTRAEALLRRLEP